MTNSTDPAETVGAPADAVEWFSGCGRLQLQIGREDASGASHQGQCDADVLALSDEPYMRRQLDALDSALVREELDGYGAWDDEELSDHEQNLQRLLWLACGAVADGDFD